MFTYFIIILIKVKTYLTEYKKMKFISLMIAN